MDTDGIIRLRFFAGAARVMGTRELDLHVDVPTTLADLVARLGTDPDRVRVLALCTWLVDSRPALPGDAVTPGVTVDALPPFAGG